MKKLIDIVKIFLVFGILAALYSTLFIIYMYSKIPMYGIMILLVPAYSVITGLLGAIISYFYNMKFGIKMLVALLLLIPSHFITVALLSMN